MSVVHSAYILPYRFLLEAFRHIGSAGVAAGLGRIVFYPARERLNSSAPPRAVMATLRPGISTLYGEVLRVGWPPATTLQYDRTIEGAAQQSHRVLAQQGLDVRSNPYVAISPSQESLVFLPGGSLHSREKAADVFNAYATPESGCAFDGRRVMRSNEAARELAEEISLTTQGLLERLHEHPLAVGGVHTSHDLLEVMHYLARLDCPRAVPALTGNAVVFRSLDPRAVAILNGTRTDARAAAGQADDFRYF